MMCRLITSGCWRTGRCSIAAIAVGSLSRFALELVRYVQVLWFFFFRQPYLSARFFRLEHFDDLKKEN